MRYTLRQKVALALAKAQVGLVSARGAKDDFGKHMYSVQSGVVQALTAFDRSFRGDESGLNALAGTPEYNPEDGSEFEFDEQNAEKFANNDVILNRR